MAITNIPIINAPSFGGFAFSLDLSRSYAAEPSKLTYKVVSNTGTYITPSIGANVSVSFNDFSFDGRIFSYELEESVSGKILSVTLVDNSTILDKLHVVVFRPGLFNKSGESKNVSLPVKFADDDKYYYKIENIKGFLQLVKKIYTDSSVTRSVRTGNYINGDIIVVGSEEPPDTKCEVASTSYVFTDLKNTVKSVSGFSNCPINDSVIRKTYEGSLRSVLNSWCQDFGYSFYWDYKTNTLKFFDLKKQVFNIPTNILDQKIVSKKTSESAEGKFNQVSCNYFIKPYTPKIQSGTTQITNKSSFSLSPYLASRFIDRNLTSDEVTAYGGGRTKSEFIESAACGYLSQSIRTIYNFSYKKIWGINCGMVGGYYKKLIASQVGIALASALYGEEINNMMAFCGVNSVDKINDFYHCILLRYDEGMEEKWHQIEQDIFTSKIGAYYPGPSTSSGEYKFCSDSYIYSISTSVNPEGQDYEDADKKMEETFAGRRVFHRGGAGPNISSAEALQSLGIDAGAKYIQGLLPTKHKVYGDSGIGVVLLQYGIVEKEDIQENNPDAYDTVMFIPTDKLIQNYLKFSAKYNRGNNQKEQTIGEIASNQNNNQKCTIKDIYSKTCLSAKEEIMSKQNNSEKTDDDDNEVYVGLYNKSAFGATISTFGASVTILASSDSSYQGCISTSISAEASVDITQSESLVFEQSGNTSTSDQLAETRFILENRTTADNLKTGKNPTPSELSSRIGYSQLQNMKKVSYTCAGFVPSLPLGTDSGLESLEMSITDSGFSATYNYSTRPAAFPTQDTLRSNVSSNPSVPSTQIR